MAMPLKFKLKVIKHGNSLKVTIPFQIAEHLGLRKGDTVELWTDNGQVVFDKKAEATLPGSTELR